MKYLLFVSGILFLSLTLSAQWSNGTHIHNTNTGNVGIGTTSPWYKLHIFNSGGGVGRQSLLRLAADGDGWDGVDFEITPGGTTNSHWFASRWGHNWHWEKSGSAGRLRQMSLLDNGRLDIYYPTTSMDDVRIRLDPTGNSYFMGGNVGIGTLNPSSRLHLFNPSSSTYLNIDKPNSGVEGGIVFSQVGTAMFYIFSDNADDDALKIETSGQPGEHDGAPRMMFPKTNKNIYMAQSGGNVGIGTNNPGTYKLAVEGTIGARKMKVTQESWADYVFRPTYRLRPLSEVEQYIQQHHHLPEVPSAAEVKKEGLDLGDNQATLLKKIEELTLYLIEQNKQLGEQSKKLEQQQQQINELEKQISQNKQ